MFSINKYKEYHQFWEQNEAHKDSIVSTVIDRFIDRSNKGIETYGTTLDRDDLSPLDWINHAQEEAMDLVLYLEKMKQFLVDKK